MFQFLAGCLVGEKYCRLPQKIYFSNHTITRLSFPQHYNNNNKMATRNYSTRADSRKRTALGDISNNGGAKPNGAKKALVASTDVRPTPPVAESQKAARSSFGRGGRAIAHVDIDAADVNDPQAETSYVNDIYAHFRATEGTFYSRFGCLCWETFFFSFFLFLRFFFKFTNSPGPLFLYSLLHLFRLF